MLVLKVLEVSWIEIAGGEIVGGRYLEREMLIGRDLFRLGQLFEPG